MSGWSALVYSRRDGYITPTPGLECTLRAAGQELRVRVVGPAWSDARGGYAPGRVRFAWPIDISPRPSGWPRTRCPAVRAGRLTVVDY